MVGVFLDTQHDRAATMQTDDYVLLVNLNNAQSEQRGTGIGAGAATVDSAWNPTWQSAVRLRGTLNSPGDTSRPPPLTTSASRGSSSTSTATTSAPRSTP